MPSTYEPIATTTLGSATASVTFSSIGGSYTDLVLVGNGQSTANTVLGFRYNGDTSTNYSRTFFLGDGSSAISGRSTSVSSIRTVAWRTDQCSVIHQISNYSNTNVYKTSLTRGTAAAAETTAVVGLWRSTSAIDSITIVLDANNIQSGSTFTLYGIKAA